MSSAPLIGVVNAGSSSLKFALYEGEGLRLSGQIDGIGVRPAFKAARADGTELASPDFGGSAPATVGEIIPILVPWIRAQLDGRHLSVLGHRVVHGGVDHAKPELVTPALLEELEALIPLAPLHEPANLVPIRAALKIAPELPQVACFDTAFHRSAPDVEQAFALPIAMFDEGVRRYGFHGLSYEYIASVLDAQAPEIARGRVVAAHLGNGASMCAMRDRVSIASSMGFTALDGLPMGTRCGSIDPGVVLYLIQQRGMSPHAVEELLYKKSGMLGLSDASSDFRDLLASDDPRARFAVEVFCYSAAREIASLAAALGGIDGIVFTAGVGEHAAPVRAAICRACAWLGVTLDEAANDRHGPRISASESRVAAYVIPTNENIVIARHTMELIGSLPIAKSSRS